MVKLTNQQALTAMMYVLAGDIEDPQNVYNTIWDLSRNPATEPVHRQMIERLREMFDGFADREDLLNNIEAQVTHRGGATNLVDFMVELLLQPWIRNHLNDQTLRQLKQVLLTAGEATELKRRIEENFRCPGCGTRLLDQEAVVLLRRGDSGYPQLGCMTCHQPVQVACPEHRCESKVGIKLTKRKPCPRHAQGATQEEQVPERVDAIFPPEGMGTINLGDLRRVFFTNDPEVTPTPTGTRPAAPRTGNARPLR